MGARKGGNTMKKYYIIDNINGNILSQVFDAPNGKKAIELFLLTHGMFASAYDIAPGKNKYHTVAINKYDNNFGVTAVEY